MSWALNTKARASATEGSKNEAVATASGPPSSNAAEGAISCANEPVRASPPKDFFIHEPVKEE